MTPHPDRRRHGRLLAAPILVLLLGVAGACAVAPAPAPSTPAPSATAGSTAPGTTSADADFVLHMLPHHQRALQVGTVMAEQGSDSRVRDFGRRILAEQTPEKDRLQGWVTTLGLSPSPGDAQMATGYVDDAAFARLRSEPGTPFDRDALLASADSESGAAAMSATELASGTYAPARELASAISTAPTGEIPELRGLAAQLG